MKQFIKCAHKVHRNNAAPPCSLLTYTDVVVASVQNVKERKEKRKHFKLHSTTRQDNQHFYQQLLTQFLSSAPKQKRNKKQRDALTPVYLYVGIDISYST